MVMPGMRPVVDDGSTKTPGWVDTRPSDGDGGQVNQEHCKPNWQRCQNLHFFHNNTFNYHCPLNNYQHKKSFYKFIT